jgi:hypothetical protein
MSTLMMTLLWEPWMNEILIDVLFMIAIFLKILQEFKNWFNDYNFFKKMCEVMIGGAATFQKMCEMMVGVVIPFKKMC